MNNFEKGNFYFGISDKKIYICFFEKGKSYYKEKINFEIPDSLNNDLNFKIITNLLKKILEKLKKIWVFLNSGNISIQSKSYQSILFSIKNIFDEKHLDKEVISNLVRGSIQKFYFGEKDLSIIHVIIDKYIIDDKEYKNLPSNIKFKKIILEIEFICLEKKLLDKVKKLFNECEINIDKIVSHEYAKKISNNLSDDTMCVAAHNIITGINQSEVYLESNNQKKKVIFYKIFNVFD